MGLEAFYYSSLLECVVLNLDMAGEHVVLFKEHTLHNNYGYCALNKLIAT